MFIVQWLVEQWCHAHPVQVEAGPQVFEVVVAASVIEAVIAEAEVLCAAAAVVEAAMVTA